MPDDLWCYGVLNANALKEVIFEAFRNYQRIAVMKLTCQNVKNIVEGHFSEQGCVKGGTWPFLCKKNRCVSNAS